MIEKLTFIVCEKFLAQTKDPIGMFGHVPTYVLVFVPADAPNGLQDASLVMENMMLAAHAQGLGSCWIHREREIFATEEGKEMMQAWGLPEGLVGAAALALGYPNGDPSPAKPRKEGYTRVIR